MPRFCLWRWCAIWPAVGIACFLAIVESTPVVHAASGATTTGAACPAILQQRFKRLQDEAPQDLCQFAGKVLLVVNTASYCGSPST